MTTPLIAIGLGLTIDDLAPFVVEPQIADGVINAQRDIGADLSVHEQGLHCVLRWPVLDGAEELQALLAQIGIGGAGATRSGVTLYLPNFEREFHLYQGYAIRPRVISYAFFPLNLTVIVNSMARLD